MRDEPEELITKDTEDADAADDTSEIVPNNVGAPTWDNWDLIIQFQVEVRDLSR